MIKLAKYLIAITILKIYSHQVASNALGVEVSKFTEVNLVKEIKNKGDLDEQTSSIKQIPQRNSISGRHIFVVNEQNHKNMNPNELQTYTDSETPVGYSTTEVHEASNSARNLGFFFEDDDDDDGKEYDSHGCCVSCGEFFCGYENTCVTDWDDCRLGRYDMHACTFTFNDSKHSFSYDLAPFAVEGFYTISDEFSHADKLFRYYFNICKGIEPEDMPDACFETWGQGNEHCKGISLAYQYVTSGLTSSSKSAEDTCYRFTDCVPVHQETRVSLGILDPVKPASGVYLQYFGGNTCENSYADKEACSHIITKHTKNTTYCGRAFRLNILCHDEINQIPEKERVVQAAGCHFEATINHRMGCPVECPRHPVSKRVCSGRGLCSYGGYDQKNRKNGGLECVCQKGYSGDACNIYSVSVPGTKHSVPVWFILFLLFVGLGAWGAVRNLDKVKLLVQGDIAGAIPELFGRRLAPDGKGFYSRVEEASADNMISNPMRESFKNPFAGNNANSSSSTNQSTGSIKLGNNKDIQLKDMNATEDDSFTL